MSHRRAVTSFATGSSAALTGRDGPPAAARASCLRPGAAARAAPVQPKKPHRTQEMSSPDGQVSGIAGEVRKCGTCVGG